MNKPRLFGINNSNRDFDNKDSWGKNQFNSSFPASLASYLHSKGLECNYIKTNDKLSTYHSSISASDLFKLNPESPNVFYAFENVYTPFQQFVKGNLPRVDLVIQNIMSGTCVSGLEIKLTALPDNSTCDLEETKYGCEIVVRPDTIVYLACSIAANYRDNRGQLAGFIADEIDEIEDWSIAANVIPYISRMVSALDNISKDIVENQKPLVMQPIWKTKGKSPVLANNCLDMFIWSDLSFLKLYLDPSRGVNQFNRINRQTRSIVWTLKMLKDFARDGQFNHKETIDNLSYNTKNDKAFAVNGAVTHPYMTSPSLTNPRILKSDIKNIIMGGGQNMLSPERRFDAIIHNTPDLFN